MTELSQADDQRLLQAATTGPVLGTTEQDKRILAWLNEHLPPPPPPPPPTPTDIHIALSADKSQGVVTALPPNTAYVTWAYMKATNTPQAEIKYSGDLKPANATPYSMAGYPVLDAVAKDANHVQIGKWASQVSGTRLVTTPIVPPTPPPPTTSSMWVGLDIGGWGGTHIAHAAKAAKVLRSSVKDEAKVLAAANAGAMVLPLFNRPGAVTAMNANEIASEVLNWFQKFGRGGSFWNGRPDLGATAAEIINEPDNEFMGRTDHGTEANAEAYTKIVRAVTKATAVLAHPPDILVSFDGGYGDNTYGPKLLKHGAFVDARECPEVHPYGGTSNREKSALGNRWRVTDAREKTGRPVYVTEVGWPTDVGAGNTPDSLQWTEQQQKENIEKFIAWAKSIGYVKGVVYFNYADYSPNMWYGVCNSAGTVEKPSFSVLH